MLSGKFADVNAAGSTPQQQLNSYIAASLEGIEIPEISPLRYATVLTKIKNDMDSVLYGDPDLRGMRIENKITEQLIRIEAADIQKAIDTSCFAGQKKAVEAIFNYGSLSSARLSGKNVETLCQPEQLDI